MIRVSGTDDIVGGGGGFDFGCDMQYKRVKVSRCLDLRFSGDKGSGKGPVWCS